MSLKYCSGYLQIRGAVETLVSSLTPLNHAKVADVGLEASKMNADLLSREVDNISLLLSLLVRNAEVFYYLTLIITSSHRILPNSLSHRRDIGCLGANYRGQND